MLNMGQSWVISQKVHWLDVMFWMHGGVFALSGLWLAKRHYNWHLIPTFKRKEAA